MDDLTLEEIKQIVNFYKQRSSDLELSNLQWQLKYNRLLSVNNETTSINKTNKTKSE